MGAADVMIFPDGAEVVVVVTKGGPVELCATKGSWLLCANFVAELAMDVAFLSKVDSTLTAGDVCAAKVGVRESGLVELWLLRIGVVVVLEPVVGTEMAVDSNFVGAKVVVDNGLVIATGDVVDDKSVVVGVTARDGEVVVTEMANGDDIFVVTELTADGEVVATGMAVDGELVVVREVEVDNGLVVVLGSVSLGTGTIELGSGTGTIELNSIASLARLAQLVMFLDIGIHSILLFMHSISPKRTCRAQSRAKKSRRY